MVGTGDRALGARGRIRPRDALSPPNVVTLARLAVVPVVVGLLLSGHRAAAAVALAVSLAGDALDGYLARRLGRSTELGRVLDPLADKIAVDAVLVCLTAAREFPLWALAVVLARDAGIAAGAAVLARRTSSVPQASWPGKAALAGLAAMAVAFTADLRPLEGPLLAAGLSLAAVSGAWYALLFRRLASAGERARRTETVGGRPA